MQVMIDIPAELLAQKVQQAVKEQLPELVKAATTPADIAYTVAELAARWRFSEKAIRSWLTLPCTNPLHLPFVQGGSLKGIRITANEANAWLTRNASKIH